jgi:hypothetical protein
LLFIWNYRLSVRIALFHNIFWPEGTWTGRRENANAAMCGKVAEAKTGGEIEVWVMENKQGLSSILMNAWKRCGGSLILTSLDL